LPYHPVPINPTRRGLRPVCMACAGTAKLLPAAAAAPMNERLCMPKSICRTGLARDTRTPGRVSPIKLVVRKGKRGHWPRLVGNKLLPNSLELNGHVKANLGPVSQFSHKPRKNIFRINPTI